MLDADALKRLTDKIDSIEAESETLYLRLGKLFQAVKQAVDADARTAEKAIESVLSGHSAKTPDNFIEDEQYFFSNAALNEKQFMEAVEQSIDTVSRLDSVIRLIRSDSEEMEIISLNAMTVALKSGPAGRAFSVITDELKKLSGRTITYADELSQAGIRMLKRLTELQEALRSLEDAQADFFTRAMHALQTGLGELAHDVQSAAASIRSLSTEAQTVRLPVSKIIEEVQLQDIIRQSLNHVKTSIETAANTTSDTYPHEDTEALFAEIAGLSAALLDTIRKDIDTSLVHFHAGIDGVMAVVRGLETSKTLAQAAFKAQSRESDIESKAAAYIKSKYAVTHAAKTINDDMLKLEAHFREMESILANFSTIVTASRIETARNKALSVISNTVNGMTDLTERLSRDISSAGDITRLFSKIAAGTMGAYMKNALSDTQRLHEETEKIQTEFSNIQAARAQLVQTELAFKPFSANFTAAMNEAAASIDELSKLSQEISAMRNALSQYAAADGVNRASQVQNEKLKSVVERFTIFSHRQEAARIGVKLNVDDTSAESGEVTLF